jgi:hypothetical protein
LDCRWQIFIGATSPGGNIVFVKPHKKKQKSGNRPVHPPAGKEHTAFAYFAQTLVGTVLASLGPCWGMTNLNRRPGGVLKALQPVQHSSSAFFLAHAGAISGIGD